jgi:prepilin-type N-terminal cleavage/methylation domain-containing protein
MSIACLLPHCSARRGFTFVELVITLAVLALIMGALSSAVLIGSRAAPSRSTTADADLAAEQAHDLIASELRYAQTLLQSSPTGVTFTVADRNGDGKAEVIRYSWSGIAGAPLLRQYNSLDAAEVLSDVHELGFEYDTVPITTTREVQGETTSPEVLLASFTDWPGISASQNGFAPSASNWATELFRVDKVALPPTTTRVDFTRVLLKMKPDLLGLSTYTVGIHRTFGGSDPRPASSSLGTTATVSLSLLDFTYSWTEARFTDVGINKLERNFAIVVKGVATPNVRVQYLQASSAPQDTSSMRWTTNSGSDWQPSSARLNEYSIPHYVYGTYTATTTSTVNVTRSYLRAVRVTLRCGGAPRLVNAVPILEHPEVR